MRDEGGHGTDRLDPLRLGHEGAHEVVDKRTAHVVVALPAQDVVALVVLVQEHEEWGLGEGGEDLGWGTRARRDVLQTVHGGVQLLGEGSGLWW